jgi:hypothetical protein
VQGHVDPAGLRDPTDRSEVDIALHDLTQQVAAIGRAPVTK